MSSNTHAAGPPADVVFTGGPVLTMDSQRPTAEAVAVQGGRIAGVGSVQDLQALVGPGTERIDLAGRTLLPGFIDPHMHSAKNLRPPPRS